MSDVPRTGLTSELIEIDEGINEFFGGEKNMTISARWGRWLTGTGPRKWWASVACPVLSIILREPNHCTACYQRYQEAKNGLHSAQD